MNSNESSALRLAKFALLSIAIVWVAGCSDDGIEVRPENTENTRIRVDDDTDQSETAAGSQTVNGQWIRVETNPEVGQYQAALPFEVLAHPDNNQAILIRFMMAHPPCSGARADVSESSDSISVNLQIGIHNNVAAMSCLAGEGRYELEVALDGLFASRSIQVVEARLPNSTQLRGTSTTAGSIPTTSSPIASTTGTSRAADTVKDPVTDPATGPVTKPNDEGDAGTSGLVGLSTEDASDLAADRGLSVRVVRLDGKDLVGTMDFRTDRVNVEVVDDVVVAIISIG